MKNLILITILVAAPFLALAQSSALNNFFNKYSDKEGYTTVIVHEELFKLLASIESEDQEELEEVVKGLKSVRVLVYENAEKKADFRKLYDEAMAAVPAGKFKELVSVKDGADNVKILTGNTTGEGKISDLLIIVSGEEEFVFLSLEGEIDLNSLSKMSGDIKIDGMEHLDKVKDKK